jgi:hypothetical protein
MAQLRPFGDFLSELAHLDREAFLARVTAPCLLFNGAEERSLPELFKTLVSGGAAGTDTPCVALRPGKMVRALSQQWIVPVEKQPGGNLFGMMITIGRAANNDVVIPDRRVSKFHAYFRQEGEAWVLTDAGSTNGTTVEGTSVGVGDRAGVRSGAVLELSSSLRFSFLSPEDLYELAQYSLTVVSAA